MALGDLAYVKLFLLGVGGKAECSLGMQCTSPFVNWRDLLAVEFRTTIVPTWRTCVGFNVAFRTITVSDVVPGTAADVVLDITGHPHGTGGGQEAPANCAYVISWRSDGIGRNTRGRNYLYGLPLAWVTGSSHWDSDAFDAVEDLVSVVLAQYGPTGFSTLARLQVISKGPHGMPLPAPQSFPITHAVFENKIRSMRKRLPG